MRIEDIERELGVSELLVDGEDVELMTPEKREKTLKRVMEKIDHRYLECILESIVHMYGEVSVEEDCRTVVHRVEI